MNDDLLSHVTRALREETSPEAGADAGALGKRRLMRAMQNPPQRRKRASGSRRLAMLAFAATFVGAAAWAGTSTPLRRWISSFESTRQVHDAEVALTPTSRAVAPSTPWVPPAPASPVEEARAVEPSVESPEPRVVRASKKSVSAEKLEEGAMKAPSPLASSAPAPEDLEALYRQANFAQFTEHDFARAVVLWDRYLSHGGPAAPMSLEARYNRGIALYRAGRTDEAKRALTPFARGEYGAYRRDDATRLLEQF